jgi:hypothetical protein
MNAPACGVLIEIRLFTPEVEVLLRMIAKFLSRSLQ